jgi:SAM-dependent methyltransferase
MSTTPVSFPDIHNWYTFDRVITEESNWARHKPYERNVKLIQSVCDQHLLTRVIEYGCGSGWIAPLLSRDLSYTGLDANPHMLTLARTKSRHEFVQHDIRQPFARPADLACSFAVLKHFSLADWPGILANILRQARFGLFNQHCLPDSFTPFDAGHEWHSCWPRNCDIEAAVLAAGHKIIWRDDSTIDPVVNAPESYFLTQQIGDA